MDKVYTKLVKLEEKIEHGFVKLDTRLVKTEEIVGRLDKSISILDKKMSEHDKRFDEHDKRFIAIECTLGEHTKKLIEHDVKLDRIIDRLTQHEVKFDKLEAKIEDTRSELSNQMADGFDKLVGMFTTLDQERWMSRSTMKRMDEQLERHEVDIGKIKITVGIQ
ncbi:MAG: hypothetical protein V1707_02135 [bacterium]